jgi:thiol-disulfide isomerase/thioredoxin
VDSVASFLKVALLMLLLGLLLGSAGGCTSECGESKVDWVYSLDEALSTAQSDNKLVMIDFYADWCPPCKKMDCETYSDDELGAFVNNNFVPLKVNVDKSSLDGAYGINPIPQVVLLSPEGTEIGEDKEYRVVGYLPPASFQGRLQAVLDAWSLQNP